MGVGAESQTRAVVVETHVRETGRKLQNKTLWMLLTSYEMCSTTPCATINDTRVGTHQCEQCNSNKMREDAVKKFVKHQRKLNFEEAYRVGAGLGLCTRECGRRIRGRWPSSMWRGTRWSTGPTSTARGCLWS